MSDLLGNRLAFESSKTFGAKLNLQLCPTISFGRKIMAACSS